MKKNPDQNADDSFKIAAAIRSKNALYLSHFTPSMMAPETLEAMLVQREPVLVRCLDRVLDSLRSGGSHHTLLVGPRGIGKTHLISLLHHRLSQTRYGRDDALIAWMREEEWGVTSFLELVLRILRTLDASYPQLDIEARTSSIYELPLKEAEKRAESLLLEVLSEKRLVLLLENLDDLFDQLGDAGHKAWRAFIQNHNNMILVCSTPSLFAGVTLQKSAFYGFFDIEPLVELDFEDVVSLLGKIAVERGDEKLAEFIETPEGRARIRAVHHLAEGNPRIYIIFAQFLSREALDELVQAFMHTLDELTPYYQARMRELSGQQRKIVEFLVAYRGAAPVKQIAKSCFITQQTCSSQLKLLKEKRYVRSIEQGRESYYELCEPLMRLCMEVKKQRGEPLSLFVEILRIWYTEDELKDWLQRPEHTKRLDDRYVLKALEAMQKQGIEPTLQAQLKEWKICIRSKKKDEALVVLDEIASTHPSNQTSSYLRAMMLLCFVRSPGLREKIRPELDLLTEAFEEMLADWEKKITRQSAEDHYEVLALASFGLFSLNETQAIPTLSRVVALLAKFPAHAYFALIKGSSSIFPPIPAEFKKCISALCHSVPQTSMTNEQRRFFKVGARMGDAFESWHETKDSSAFLALPVEERKLLVALTK